MPTEGEKTHSLVEKFGSSYKDEIPVKVGGYDFYVDMFSFGGDLSRNLSTSYDGNNRWTPEGRKSFLERDGIQEELKMAANVLKRYGVKQEMIKGVGLLGSVTYLELSRGEKEGKILGKKILIFEHHGDIYLEGERGVEEFGIPLIEGNMEMHIPLLEENKIIKESDDLSTTVIDNLYDRLRYLNQEMRRDRSLSDLSHEASEVLSYFDPQETEQNNQVNTLLGFVLSKMGFVDSRMELPDNKQLIDRGDKRQYRSILENTLIFLEHDIESSRSRSVKEGREVGFEGGLFGRVEKMLLNGQNILVMIPEGLSIIPALYLAVQEIAKRYGVSEENIVDPGEVKEHWKKVVYDLDDIKEGSKEVLVLAGDIYNDWDEESGLKSEVKRIIGELGSEGVQVTLVDLLVQDIFEMRRGRLVKVSERDGFRSPKEITN